MCKKASRPRFGIRDSAVIAAVICAGSTAGADIETAVYGHPFSFSFEYKVSRMPDLDQRRLWLPNQGAMYCVPTAIMNLYAYAANHGFPDQPPGAGNWQSDALFTTATNSIDKLGEWMGTDPDDGTSLMLAGPHFWATSNNTPLTVDVYFATPAWFPRIGDIVKSAVTTDGIVAFGYGRWRYFPDSSSDLVNIGSRSGGHMVTLSEAERTTPFRASIGVRDPADAPQEGLYLLTQSPFETRMFPDAHDKVITGGDFTTGISEAARFGTALEFPPPFTSTIRRLAIIDSYIRIRPMMGYGWETSEITFNFPNHFQGPSNQHLAAVAMESIVVDTALAPEADSLVAVINPGADASTMLVEVDLLSGETVEIGPAPDACGLVFGRKRELYVILPEEILCFDFDVEKKTPTTVAPLPGVGAALAYNDMTDEILALLPGQSMVVRYRDGLPEGVPPTMMPIPQDVQMGDSGALAVNPADGGIWFITDASDDVYNLMEGPEGPMVEMVSLPEIISPRALCFDDVGNMFVMSDKGLAQLRRNPLNNQWMIAEDPLFGDMDEPMDGFSVSRSRTNFDPAIHAAPEFLNFDPSENDELFDSDFQVPDLIADLNGDGRVNAQDLGILLGSWGDCSPKSEPCPADINGDGVVNAQDLGILLGEWGATE